MTDIKAYIIRYLKKHPITSFMILINTFFFILTLFTGGFDLLNLIRLGAILPPLITEEGEFYRLITGTFLHGNVFHFLMNMYVLFFLGAHLEQLVGPTKQLIVYVLSGLASSVAVTYLGSETAVTVGASGAIFGIMGGLFMLTILRKRWFHQKTIRSIQQLMGINLILTFVVANISILGHLGGLLMGVLLFFVIAPERPYIFTQREKQNR